MNREEFVRSLAAEYGMTISESKEICEAVLAHMKKVMETEDLNIFGFGAFKRKLLGEHVAVHPQTKERIVTPPRYKIRFIPSTATKRSIGEK